jgi:hypothetical protein
MVALAQVYFGTVLVSPFREPGAPWDVGYAVLSAVASIGGLTILALAVRNCLRLWRVPPHEASWALVTLAVPVTLFSGLWATGPMTLGVWHWYSLVPGTFAAYLIVVLVREVRRLQVRSRNAFPPRGSQYPGP